MVRDKKGTKERWPGGELYIQNGVLWSSQGSEKAGLWVVEGKIRARVTDHKQEKEIVQRARVIDARGMWVFPGIIDTQVHFREPGLEHKEDLETGSLGALLGGVTTFLEMPNTSPATTSCEAVGDKLERARHKSHVNYGFFIGATANNLSQLQQASHYEGCCGIKIFLGSSTGDLLMYDPQRLREIFLHTDLPISIHSEDETRLQERLSIKEQATSVHAHPRWRDVLCALQSTQMVVELARECKRKIHILHVSTQDEMRYLARNKDVVTVEVTPQHLSLYAPDCYDRLGTRAQMNPPVRDQSHQEGLWRGVLDRTVDVLGSDHAPHTLEEKSQPYPRSPAGMPGVQTIFPVMLDHVQQGRLSMQRLVELLCERPSQLFSLPKGYLQPGYDGDITIIDPHTPITFEDHMMASRSAWTPFAGKTVPCSVSTVVVGGEVALHRDTAGEYEIYRVDERQEWVPRQIRKISDRTAL